MKAVQYLLIAGQYLQGTQKSTEAWAVHGLAVRAAMQLGLHSSESSRGLSLQDCETRKRVWFGAVVLDRSMSMTFGRPSAIPETYSKLELPRPYPNDSISPGGASVESRNNTNIAFFSATITMYKVMWEALDVLYGQNLACGKENGVTDIVGHLLLLEQRLLNWRQSLPPSLRIVAKPSSSSGVGWPFDLTEYGSDQKLSVILTLRYLNLRLLLHRPILTRLLDYLHDSKSHQDEAVLLQQFGSSSIYQCNQTAAEIIYIVYSATKMAKSRDLLGAFWFTNYYVFQAALISFGCYFVSIPRPGILTPALNISNDEIAETLRKAVSALERLNSDNEMVARCRHYLVTLNTVVMMIANNSGLPSLDLTQQTSINVQPASGSNRQPALPELPFEMNFGDLMDFNF